MKTVFKRLFSLMLVAMMLVSVLPFQASAEEVTVENGNKYDKLVYGYTVRAEDVTAKKTVADIYQMIVAGNNPPAEYTTIECVTPNSSVSKDDATTAVTEGTYYSFAFMKLISKSTPVKVTVGTEVKQDGNMDIAAAGCKVSDVLATLGIDNSGYDVNPGLGTAVVPGTAIEITLSTRPNPESIALYYRNEGTDMSDKTADAFATYTTLNTPGGVVPELFVGSWVRDNKNEKYNFVSWTSNPDGTGTKLSKGMTLTYNSPTTYYAQYTKDTTVLNRIQFYAVPFVDGIAQPAVKLNYSLDLAKNDAVSSALSSDEVKLDLQNAIDGAGYGYDFAWTAGTYYLNSACTTGLSTTTTVDSGLNIYLKVEYTGKNTVLVYPHKSYNDDPRPIQMKGYALGDAVEFDDVYTAVRNYYTFSKSNMLGLFDDEDWAQIKDAGSSTSKYPNGAANMVVEGDNLVIHVLLTSVSSSSSSNNSDNPKTGDSVLLTFVVMGLSASALATLYFLNKKKQVF